MEDLLLTAKQQESGKLPVKKARTIGAFAKGGAEKPATPASRAEVGKLLFDRETSIQTKNTSQDLLRNTPAEKAKAQRPANEILRQTVTKPEGRSIVAVERIKRPEQMQTPDLLRVASTLYIDGVSVKELYETNRIDRRGLIRLIQVSLKGGELKDAFEQVELGRERQVERAREFRHDDNHSGLPMADQSLARATLPQPQSLVVTADLPNSPDSASLQPLHTTLDAPTTGDASTINTLEKPIKRSPPTLSALNQHKLILLASIAIISLVLWAIIS